MADRDCAGNMRPLDWSGAAIAGHRCAACGLAGRYWCRDGCGDAVPDGGDVSDIPDPSSLSPDELAALPETSRIAVSMLFSDAFTWLYMVAVGLSVIGLTAAILLRPPLMPVSERAS